MYVCSDVYILFTSCTPNHPPQLWPRPQSLHTCPVSSHLFLLISVDNMFTFNPLCISQCIKHHCGWVAPLTIPFLWLQLTQLTFSRGSDRGKGRGLCLLNCALSWWFLMFPNRRRRGRRSRRRGRRRRSRRKRMKMWLLQQSQYRVFMLTWTSVRLTFTLLLTADVAALLIAQVLSVPPQTLSCSSVIQTEMCSCWTWRTTAHNFWWRTRCLWVYLDRQMDGCVVRWTNNTYMYTDNTWIHT